jgi:hypothetical protein
MTHPGALSKVAGPVAWAWGAPNRHPTVWNIIGSMLGVSMGFYLRCKVPTLSMCLSCSFHRMATLVQLWMM